MENQLHTTTLQLSCDVTFIVPANFEELDNDEKARVVLESLKNNYIKSVDVCYWDEVKEIIDAMY